MTTNAEGVSADDTRPAMNLLLTDDLGTLLGLFPNEALRAILGIMAGHTSWSPFPDRRATAAHQQPADADLRPFAREIACEVMWWGANDVHRDLGHQDTWPEVLRRVAKSEGLKARDLDGRPAWQIEQAILTRVLSRWEQMTSGEREEVIQRSGAKFDAAWGGALAAGGGAMAATEAMLVAGGPRLLSFLASRLAPLAIAAPAVPFVAPVLTVLGAAWAAYDLAGPAFRVLRPVALTVAFTRRRLREARSARAFEE